MTVELIDPAGYRHERWKNGQGWTQEIARGRIGASSDGAATDASPPNYWDWRLSIATIECDGPFSAFPGIDRTLVLLDGNGMRLDFDDGAQIRLDQRGDRIDFAGERSLRSVLHHGATRDFNAMWRRSHVRGSVVVMDVAGSTQCTVADDELVAVHVIDGCLAVGTYGDMHDRAASADGKSAHDDASSGAGSYGSAGTAGAGNGSHSAAQDRCSDDDGSAGKKRGSADNDGAGVDGRLLRRASGHPASGVNHGSDDFVDVASECAAGHRMAFARMVRMGHTLIDRRPVARTLDLSGPATAVIARFGARKRR